jgi:hypothetical protein
MTANGAFPEKPPGTLIVKIIEMCLRERKPKDLKGIVKIGTDNNLVDYTVHIAFVIFLF